MSCANSADKGARYFTTDTFFLDHVTGHRLQFNEVALSTSHSAVSCACSEVSAERKASCFRMAASVDHPLALKIGSASLHNVRASEHTARHNITWPAIRIAHIYDCKRGTVLRQELPEPTVRQQTVAIFCNQQSLSCQRPSAPYQILRSLWNPNVHYRALNSLPLVTILSHVNPLEVLPPCLRDAHVTLQRSPVHPPPTKTQQTSLFPHTCYMLRPSHPR